MSSGDARISILDDLIARERRSFRPSTEDDRDGSKGQWVTRRRCHLQPVGHGPAADLGP